MATQTKKAMTKTDMLNSLSESTGLSKKDVGAVIDGLGQLIGDSMGKKGPGVFNLAGLVKIEVVQKKASPAKTMPNPFKPGEMMQVAAKPAKKVVKVKALKGLKDMV